jgi:hypothetical protein
MTYVTMQSQKLLKAGNRDATLTAVAGHTSENMVGATGLEPVTSCV